MTKEQKEAIEYLKIRLYGNEGCKCIDIAQEDLRIFINLVDCLQKENEELKEIYRSEKKMKNKYIKLYQDLLLKENIIPIQKVKDKIKEILNNGEYRIIFEGDAEFPDEAAYIYTQKYIKLEKLQELLEGEK